jgi:hypothetical protein
LKENGYDIPDHMSHLEPLDGEEDYHNS